jgi:hypothetical protein
MSYVSRSTNPFEDEPKFGNRNNNNNNLSHEDDLRFIQEKIGKVENDSLESTRRALRMLNETEEVGVKTAAELEQQGEKLKGIEENLDGIDSTLTATQRNLNQIKSVFGGLKNKFFGPKQRSNTSTNLKDKAEKSSISASQSMNNMKETTKTPEFVTITGSDREQELNKNLEDMSAGLSRLKDLGLAMNRELTVQDSRLDRIGDKVTYTDAKVKDQNAQMKRILK